MMGAWGPGLYSGDFACDLRSTVAALARLPFDGEKILEIARETGRRYANDPQDEDYTTFWLVIADQFQKRGIECAAATQTALEVIDSGADAAMMQKLGMSASNLRKRTAGIAELRQRIADGPARTTRRTLSKPQAFTMDIGDVFAFPTSQGQSINAYSADKHVFGWSQDAWGALLVVDRGRAFDYLAWYAILVVKEELYEKPSMSSLARVPWTLRLSGTCSPIHFKRLELEFVGKVEVDRDAVVRALGAPVNGRLHAIQDISICNYLRVVSKNPSQPVVQPNLERQKAIELSEFAR
jgi:hypothetical protein